MGNAMLKYVIADVGLHCPGMPILCNSISKGEKWIVNQ